MKVLLKQDVKGQGKAGQIVSVSDGYARNFLFPRQLAVPADAAAVNEVRTKEEAAQYHAKVEKDNSLKAADVLKDKIIEIKAKAGSAGRLFGSVTTKEVSEALKAQYGVDLPKTRLELGEPIKSFGTYQVKAKLYTEIQGVVTVKVEEA